MSKNNYWFKRRRYGFGWIPVTWQGWLTLALVLIIIFMGTYLYSTSARTSQSFFLLLNTIAMAIILGVIVSTWKGPSAKWRWGKKDDDNDEEDF